MQIRRMFPFVLVAATPSAFASHMMCTFHSAGDPEYALEFLGYERVQQILFDLPGQGGAGSLRGGAYELLQFDEQTRSIHLLYTTPGDSTLPPSFTLKGSGKDVRLSIGGKALAGEFNCGL